MQASILAPGTFVPATQQWQPIAHHTTAAHTSASLTVATLNVWFGHDAFDQRCHATLALLASYQPDMITLQEVTPAFLRHILSTPWVRAAYTVSDIIGNSIDPYGVLMLSRLPISNWQLVALPSAMGRHVCTARALLNDTTTTFATVHLESQAYAAPTRVKQLARIFPLLASDPHVVLTGDFNFCATWDENQRLDPTYQDVWPLLRRTEPGFTIDTDMNSMRFRHTGARKQVRFDRMLLRSQSPGWRAEAIQLIGTAPLSSTTPQVFPSDHFGLLGRFRWQAADAAP